MGVHLVGAGRKRDENWGKSTRGWAARAAGQAIDMLRETLLPTRTENWPLASWYSRCWPLLFLAAAACTIECGYLDKSARNYKTPWMPTMSMSTNWGSRMVRFVVLASFKCNLGTLSQEASCWIMHEFWVKSAPNELRYAQKPKRQAKKRAPKYIFYIYIKIHILQYSICMYVCVWPNKWKINPKAKAKEGSQIATVRWTAMLKRKLLN